MECVDGALRSSILKEISMSKLTPHAVLDEFWSVNMQNGASCVDFSVDDLLDFSNLQQEENEQLEPNHQQKTCAFVSVSLKQDTPHQDSQQTSHFHNLFDSLPSSDFSVPADELESLEWLSHFVEDSNSEYSAQFVDEVQLQKPKFENSRLERLGFKTPIPSKARSKRTRTGVRVWSLGSPESSSTSTSSSSSTTTISTTASSSPWLICTNRIFSSQMVEPVVYKTRVVKKHKKNLLWRLNHHVREEETGSLHGGVVTMGCRKRRNGEPGRKEGRLCVTHVGFGSSRVDSFLNIDQLVAQRFRANCIPTTIRKYWR